LVKTPVPNKYCLKQTLWESSSIIFYKILTILKHISIVLSLLLMDLNLKSLLVIETPSPSVSLFGSAGSLYSKYRHSILIRHAVGVVAACRLRFDYFSYMLMSIVYSISILLVTVLHFSYSSLGIQTSATSSTEWNLPKVGLRPYNCILR